jgi:predicted lipid-binding transport protein (Tim44 family)
MPCQWIEIAPARIRRVLAVPFLHRQRDPDPSTKHSEEATAMSSEKQGSNRGTISGLVFVGCLMLGFAAGFLTGNLVPGLFGGLGIGFIGMAIAYYVTGE